METQTLRDWLDSPDRNQEAIRRTKEQMKNLVN